MKNSATAVSPENAALLLIDHQIGTMRLIKNLPLERVQRHTLALARAAAALNMPAVLTSSQETQFQGPLMPELAEILPSQFATRIQRTGIVNAWDDPSFTAAVRGTGRTHLIMAGVTTDVCLIYPALSAVAAGFHVQAVMDASGSPFELSEKLACDRMQAGGVVLTATNTLFAELAQDWSSPTGTALIDILMRDVLGPILTAS
jgi:nicotinamidase-related amidase